ncbi:MAG: YeeE/YedE family protein [Bacteroidales bacterium]|nr:YeeE/YedE family protein [Bacteroidales bacterium]
MVITILIFGVLFGAIMQYGRLNKNDVISGMATLEDYTVIKTIGLAIGIGIILLGLEIGIGIADYHIKPFVLGGVILGGLLFGIGMAILGYCPGTLAISLGEGSIDAFVGILGGLLGGLVYTLVLPFVNPILGPNLGSISLHSLIGTGALYYIIIVVLGLLLIVLAFWISKKENSKGGNKWIITGVGLGILNPIVFLTATTNRPIGASTSFPYLADFLSGVTNNDYFTKIETPGHWETIFLLGAFMAALFISLFRKEFKFTLIYSRWESYHGSSSIKRIVWAFIGGFILIFGARMAGGCTSGHILSGGMQLAISSIVFAIFTFASLIITGKFFYRKPKE